MNIEFRKPTESDAKDIATWKYDGVYSFYDNDKTKAKNEYTKNLHNEENTFAMYNEKNELIGHCSFDYDDEDKQFSLGVQMRPSLTGKGMGTDVVSTILNFGKETYKFNELVLLVAKFNKRAIKIYERLGFKTTDEFMWHVNEEDQEFIAMKKNWE